MNSDATAQDAYKQILREHVAPALRELGFRGAPSRGNFRYGTTAHAAEVRFQKSRGSTRQEVDFWVLNDPRAFQALLARLETDPGPCIRQGVAWYLLGRAHEDPSAQALRAAAAEDEDTDVRWIARYALKPLTARQGNRPRSI